MKDVLVRLVAAAGVAVFVLATGCGDDGNGGGGGDPDAGFDEEVQMCLQEAGDMEPCTVCGCENCFEDLELCNEIDGCREIVDCARQTGCVGTACYLANPTCMAVIDDNGGPFGAAASQATVVSDCVVEADCPCEAGTLPDGGMGDGGADDGGTGDGGTGDGGV